MRPVTKSQVNKEGWERSDFPIVCETCLGDNPYVRMTKAEFDKECKVCGRPFTVFRWRPGAKARYKKTEVCQTCAKFKNVCQVCLLDLEYGLPTQVRDSALAKAEQIPLSEVNREYFADQAALKVNQGIMSFDKAHVVNNTLLQKLARTAPYYKRNRAHICSFFVKGECNRGDECPFRHEMPEEGELAHQNIKDRYHGVNDPVAKKLMGRADAGSKTPLDTEITTLHVAGVTPDISEEDLRDQFYAYGEIKSVKIVAKANCAFIQYTTREGAEKAYDKLFNKLIVKGKALRVAWGKPPSLENPTYESSSSSTAPLAALPPPPSGLTALPPGFVPNPNYGLPGFSQPLAAPGAAPPPSDDGTSQTSSTSSGGVLPAPGSYPPPTNYVPFPAGKAYYPSMDPNQMGAKPESREAK